MPDKKKVDQGASVGAAELHRLAAVLGQDGILILGIDQSERCRLFVQPRAPG